MNLNEQLSKLVKDKFREEIQKLPLSSISYLKMVEKQSDYQKREVKIRFT